MTLPISRLILLIIACLGTLEGMFCYSIDIDLRVNERGMGVPYDDVIYIHPTDQAIQVIQKK